MTTGKANVATATVPNDLEPYWMPFTANRAFKARPRLVARAKDMHYFTPDGRKLIDGAAGLWCTNAGHNRDPIVAAIQRQAAELDYAPVSRMPKISLMRLAVIRHRPISPLRSKILWIGKWRLKMKFRQYSIWAPQRR